MSWLEVTVRASASAIESSAADGANTAAAERAATAADDRLAETLLACGAVSVTFRSFDAEEVLEPAPQTTPLWTRTALTGLFSLDTDLADIRGALGPDVEVAVAFLEERDWINQWQAHATSLRFGDRLWIVPRVVAAGLRAEVAAFAGTILRLDPGMAFGTGSHPSTRLCLEWLAGASLQRRSVLDYGCGSGVLAVAASLLGAGTTVAVDHDPQALLSTRDNANYNGATLSSVVLPGALDPDARFAVIVANILANPLIELAPWFVERLEPGGQVVLAGVLSTQGNEVMAAYPDIDFEEPVEVEGWIRLTGCLHG